LSYIGTNFVIIHLFVVFVKNYTIKTPGINIELVRLAPLMLDWLGPDYITRDELSLRGYDVPCYP